MVKAASYWNVRLAAQSVCQAHSAPAEFVRQQIEDRVPLSLWQGPRGGGKSFCSGLGAWLDSLLHDHHGTRILGGSLAQSGQIYEAMRTFDRAHLQRSPLLSFSKRAASFCTGSEVSILAASPTAVRGPHVARLRLDEVDEIPEDLRDSALGMCVGLRGIPASVVMTSTWHKVGGPMTALMERGRAGEFPVSTFCIFEVLERCPPERSGAQLEKCPECPIMKWCHEDRNTDHARAQTMMMSRRAFVAGTAGMLGLPKAKRSNGHYPIESLIQKVRGVSARVFASDYLCEGPKAADCWFTTFSDRNISPSAEFDVHLPVHVAVDSGVFTGAVFFQVRPVGQDQLVTVFDDFLAEGVTADVAALSILAQLKARCGDARRRISTDSAGGARNPVGPSVIAEYLRCGLTGQNGIEQWPRYPGSVQNGLALLEALICSANGSIRLLIHPRCLRLVSALRTYSRARRAGQLMDYPKDPDHPHEDLCDALRGGCSVVLGDSRAPKPLLGRERASRVF